MITLINERCETALLAIPNDSIDAVICDPPFGTTQCQWDIALDMQIIWAEYRRILRPHGVILLFAAQPFTSVLIMSNPKLFRYVWYWEKEKGTGFLNVRNQPLRVIEEVCVFAKTAQFTYHPQMVPLDKPYRHTMPMVKSEIAGHFQTETSQTVEHRQYRTYTHGHPKNLLRFSRDNANKGLVPTQKPVALLEYLVRTYTDEGHAVLDNTMGSGTCGVACKRLNRHFVGMESDLGHFQLAKTRIEAEPAPSSLIAFHNNVLLYPKNEEQHR